MSNLTGKSSFKLNKRQKWVCAPESLIVRMNYTILSCVLFKKKERKLLLYVPQESWSAQEKNRNDIRATNECLLLSQVFIFTVI